MNNRIEHDASIGDVLVIVVEGTVCVGTVDAAVEDGTRNFDYQKDCAGA